MAATLLYVVATVAFTWPLAPRVGGDVPGDLLDPLFSCWALGWNFHNMGLSPGGPPSTGYWDANIFHPTTHVRDFTQRMKRSSLRLYWLSRLAGPVNSVLHSLGLRCAVQYGNVLASRLQYETLLRGYWHYGLLTAQRP